MRRPWEAAGPSERNAVLARLADDRDALRTLITRRGGAAAFETRLAVALAAADAVVSLLFTQWGGTALIAAVEPEGPRIEAAPLPSLTVDAVEELWQGQDPGTELAGWVGAYFSGTTGNADEAQRVAWRSEIARVGEGLGALFARDLAGSLEARGIEPGSRVVILPQGLMGALPVGLAEISADGELLMERYELVQAPSLAAFARADAARGADRLAAVANPTGDLRFAAAEGAIVASWYPGTANSLNRGAASKPAVLAALAKADTWHLATHARFNWADPRASFLALAAEERLTVSDLLEATGLASPRLVVLSACETGLSVSVDTPDEFIGLPAAFMEIGAQGVIASLWPVSDEASALLMSRFYELHIGRSMAPSAALREAQFWLRDATLEELSDYVTSFAAEGRISENQKAELHRAILERSPRAPQDPEARPYSHPYYWAAFNAYGR
jgi:hypothetical protein